MVMVILSDDDTNNDDTNNDDNSNNIYIIWNTWGARKKQK